MRDFTFPSGKRFSIQQDWLDESGITYFAPLTPSYGLGGNYEAELVHISEIAPPQMGKRLRWGPNGLHRDRMISVLREIAMGEIVWPIKVMNWPHKQFRFILSDGAHRLHASVIAGFTHIHIIHGWVHESERPNQNSV